MSSHVYILFSRSLNRFYIGYTSNLNNRLQEHNNGESQYTSGGIPWILIWSTNKYSIFEAETLEKKLKNLSKDRKVKFMKKYREGLAEEDILDKILY